MQNRKIPATVVTGFLGAGKTSLVRHALGAANGRRIAVIVNEFGDLGIDEAVLRGCGDDACDAACGELYGKLRAAGREPLYDDRDERAGAKFADMDLIGVPWQLVVGPRGIANGVVELKRRAGGERHEISVESALSRLTG